MSAADVTDEQIQDFKRLFPASRNLATALEESRKELAALRRQLEERESPDMVTVTREEWEILQRIVRLLDEARERYRKHPRGAGGQAMGDEIDDLMCRLYEMGVHPALRASAQAHSAGGDG